MVQPFQMNSCYCPASQINNRLDRKHQDQPSKKEVKDNPQILPSFWDIYFCLFFKIPQLAYSVFAWSSIYISRFPVLVYFLSTSKICTQICSVLCLFGGHNWWWTGLFWFVLRHYSWCPQGSHWCWTLNTGQLQPTHWGVLASHYASKL